MPSSFTCVRKFVSTLQYGKVGLSTGNADQPGDMVSSGIFARISQTSVDVRPVLTPPCTHHARRAAGR